MTEGPENFHPRPTSILKPLGHFSFSEPPLQARAGHKRFPWEYIVIPLSALISLGLVFAVAYYRSLTSEPSAVDKEQPTLPDNQATPAPAAAAAANARDDSRDDDSSDDDEDPAMRKRPDHPRPVPRQPDADPEESESPKTESENGESDQPVVPVPRIATRRPDLEPVDEDASSDEPLAANSDND